MLHHVVDDLDIGKGVSQPHYSFLPISEVINAHAKRARRVVGDFIVNVEDMRVLEDPTQYQPQQRQLCLGMLIFRAPRKPPEHDPR